MTWRGSTGCIYYARRFTAVFTITHRDGLARLGRLETPHGMFITPTLLPVVNPRRLTLTIDELHACGAEALITNSYIIRSHDELRGRALAGGVHALLGWDGPLMTDSGTFQAHVYGEVAVEPDEIIAFQREIGSDIGTVLDLFTEPDEPREKAVTDWDTTQQRIAAAVDADSPMLLAATVQGGLFPDLRERAARDASALAAGVHPIGGVVPLMEDYRFADLVRVVLAAKRGLVPTRPVHLFGCGHPMLFALATLLGCDLFDSASYAKFAADDRLLFAWGTRHLKDLEELPCGCAVCAATTPARLRALPDNERQRALARHNLLVSFTELRHVRQAVRDGRLWELVETRLRSHPALYTVFAELRSHAAWLGRFEPACRDRAPQLNGPESLHRPVIRNVQERLNEVQGVTFSHPLFGPVPVALAETQPVAAPPGMPRVDPGAWDAARVRAIAAFQFGAEGAAALLDGALKLVRSRNTGRLRNVIVGGEHRLSLNARTGRFTLRAPGARALHRATQSPRYRLVVEAETAAYNRDGRNVFCQFVRGADPALRPRDECLVVTPDDELAAVGRLEVAPAEIAMGQRRLAVRVREGLA